MKNLRFSISGVIILGVILSGGCAGNAGEKKQEQEQAVLPAPVSKTPLVIGNETALLLKDLADNGDYVNSLVFPSLIKSTIVNQSLGTNILVIDLRSSDKYKAGHIKAAVSRKFEELPAYFESGIKPFEYEKIILVCEDGQVSSYATSLLRLMGYGNVFAMRNGMSAWNKKYADEGWMSGVSGKFEADLETKVNERPAAVSMPELNTGFSTGEEIGNARFKKLFEEGTADILVSADEVFADPGKYFVINLERKDKYEDGHIPGSIRYKPESTLGFTEEMASIPSDKIVVLYCGTGHNSGFASAYLRLFGYDARTLRYGNNSFMHDKMIKQREALSWLPFTYADVNDFAVVK